MRSESPISQVTDFQYLKKLEPASNATGISRQMVREIFLSSIVALGKMDAPAKAEVCAPSGALTENPERVEDDSLGSAIPHCGRAQPQVGEPWRQPQIDFPLTPLFLTSASDHTLVPKYQFKAEPSTGHRKSGGARLFYICGFIPIVPENEEHND